MKNDICDYKIQKITPCNYLVIRESMKPLKLFEKNETFLSTLGRLRQSKNKRIDYRASSIRVMWGHSMLKRAGGLRHRLPVCVFIRLTYFLHIQYLNSRINLPDSWIFLEKLTRSLDIHQLIRYINNRHQFFIVSDYCYPDLGSACP